MVACTQEKRLFTGTGRSNSETPVAPIRFVNIRETGGWSKDGGKAGAKIAALLAVAHLPEPEPVATVPFKSQGRLLIIGETRCRRAGGSVDGRWMSTSRCSAWARVTPRSLQERRYPVLAGAIEPLRGWLGAFELTWTRSNPIDLDLCTRCNACRGGLPGRRDRAGLPDRHEAVPVAPRLCQGLHGGRCDRFQPRAGATTETFDLVLDLRAQPAFTQHVMPQGYLHWNGRDLAALAATARAGGRVRQAAIRQLQAKALRTQPQRAYRM